MLWLAARGPGTTSTGGRTRLEEMTELKYKSGQTECIEIHLQLRIQKNSVTQEENKVFRRSKLKSTYFFHTKELLLVLIRNCTKNYNSFAVKQIKQ